MIEESIPSGRDSKPGVLVIAPQPFYEWRGSPIRVAFLVQALAELGYGVDLLCLPLGIPKSIPGVTIHRAWNPLRIKTIPIGPSFRKLFFDVFLFAKAIALVWRRPYMAIHGIEDAGLMAVVLGKIRGAKIVFEKHSDPFSYCGGFWRNLVLRLYAAVERLTMRHADAVIATGLGLVKQVQQAAPHTAVHYIFDIPSSVQVAEPARVARARQEWQKSADELLIAYAGSFAIYQGLDLMFSAMPSVIAASPEARFIVVGGQAEEIADRRAWLRARGIEQFVRFVGRIPPDELPHYLASADILLSPRMTGQNSPLKILDYLSAGTAIVAVDTPANRLLLDEKNALMTEATPNGFAAGILRLLNDASRREELGAQGRGLIDEVYNYREFKKKQAACYRELLATEAPGRFHPAGGLFTCHEWILFECQLHEYVRLLG